MFGTKKKWKTVNIINQPGLIVKIFQYGKIFETPAVVKIQKLEGNENRIRCIVDTGFSTEEVSTEYVMSLFGLNNISQLIDFKPKS